jgi:hypothetical protein
MAPVAVLALLAVVALAPGPALAIDNLVRAPDVPSLDAPWGTGPFSRSSRGGYWVSRNAQVHFESVRLPDDPFTRATGLRTALHVANRSRRDAHVFGTTAQHIAVKPNRSYRLALWASARGLGSSGAVNIALEPSWTVRVIALGAGTHDWRYYSVVFNTGPWSTIDLRVISEDVGEAWLTGFLLHELSETTGGVAHAAYRLGGVAAHAFVFPPAQFFVAAGPAAAHHTAVKSRGADPVVVVNGTFVVGGEVGPPSRRTRLPRLPCGDFVLDGSGEWRLGLDGQAFWYDQAGDDGARAALYFQGEFLTKRYHFAISAGALGVAPGQVPDGPPAGMQWAIGGLGGLLRGGRPVPLETTGRHLFDGIGGGAPVARSALGATWDGQVVLLVVGEGATRSAGATVAEVTTELRALGVRDGALLDGGSATLAYHRSPAGGRLLARSSGYDANWSFVGAAAGPERVRLLPGPPPQRPTAPLPGPTFEATPRPPVSGRP